MDSEIILNPDPQPILRSIPEFKRELQPSKDLGKYWHLFLNKDSKDKPLRWPENTVIRQPVDLIDFFGCPGPIEVEIGCGKGGFLVEYALRHPEIPMLAIENEAAIAFHAATRIARRPQLPHTRLVLGDAFYLIRDFLPHPCVQAFHMYFPDPWPKKRHHKLRLLKPAFLEVVKQAALPGALFYWGTDHAEYHEEASAFFAAAPWLKMVQADAPPTEGIQTNFERKYRAMGKPIHRCVFKVLAS
jgi:tRNA (guanine-N7-)-methyltransferase